MRGTEPRTVIWRLSLEQIDSTVSAQLGPGRVTGNEHGPCFSRQISMYLAKHVGGWSMVKIGRFFNGRHHTTVLHAIKKVEQLRMTDESVDALVEVLIATLRDEAPSASSQDTSLRWANAFVEAITQRVLHRLAECDLGGAPQSLENRGADLIRRSLEANFQTPSGRLRTRRADVA